MEKRTHEIRLRVTEKEWTFIKENCPKPKVAKWIRELTLNKLMKKDFLIKKENLNKLKIDPFLLRQLVGIGNNLNQLARHVNKTGEIFVLTELALIQKDIRQIRQILSDS